MPKEESEEENKKDSSERSNSTWLAWLPAVLSIGLILGAVAVYSYFKSPSSPKSKQTEFDMNSTSGDETRFVDAEIVTGDINEGKTITIESAKLTTPSRIVVYEEVEGKLGNLLGESELLPEGENSGFTISLNKSVLEGQILYLVVFPKGWEEGQDPSSQEVIKKIDGDLALFKVVVLENSDSQKNTDGSL